MKRIALALACAAWLAARAADCPAPGDMQPQQLIGVWQAQVDGQPAAVLRLQQHPAYPGSLSGSLDRHGTVSRVAADLDDGDLTLEESADGVHIDATWLGTLREDSCGTTIEGTWTHERDPSARAFVLRRSPPSH